MIPGMMGVTATSRLAARSCTIVEDEYVGEVTSASTGANFGNVVYPINPGQAALFPWLSKQAAQWEKYHFNQLEFYYKPEVSQFATAGTTGKVIFMVDYDASDGPPTTKQAMEDTIPHTDCMPHQAMRMPLNARTIHALYQTLYVRPAGLPGASDIKTYDAGNLNVATIGIAANATKLGELRVKYSVTFSVPVLETGAGAPANNNFSSFTTTGQSTGTNPTNLPMLTGTAIQNGLNIVPQASGASLVAPVGNYVVQYFCSLTTASGLSPAVLEQLIGVNVESGPFAIDVSTAMPQFFWQSDGTPATAISLLLTGTGAGDVVTTIVSILAV